MRKISLQKQIKECLSSETGTYTTPEGTIFRAKVLGKAGIAHRIAIAEKLGRKSKEVRDGGVRTQNLLKDLIDNEELLFMCLNIENMQKQQKYTISECIEILLTKHKKELPRGVKYTSNYTSNSTYLGRDYYYNHKSLNQYVQVAELVPMKYRNKWLQ